MALTLKLDDIKPLLGAVGLGEDPTPAPKPVNNIPPPPMQMPPTPAAAGFSEWASDPQNAKKVTDGITQPGTPLLPPTPPPAPLGANMPPPPQMASVNPPVIPRPSIAPPTQGATPTLAQWQASNPGSVENHMGKGQRIFQAIASGLVGAAGGIKGDPLAGANYAQGIVANDQGIDARNQARYQGAVIQPLKDAAALQDQQAQADQRRALATQEQAKAKALGTPKPEKPENPQQLYASAVADALDRGVDPGKDPKVQQIADAITSLQRQPAAPKEPSRDDQAIAIYSKPPGQRTAQENAFLKGYEQYVKTTKTDPGVARTSVLLQMPTAIADPNHPGGVIYSTRQGAIGQGAPSGIDTQVPLNVAKTATSGTVGQQMLAVGTAREHMKLFSQLSDALDNGDVQAANKFANMVGIQLGSDKATNLQIAAQAFGGEVGRAFDGAGVTAGEREKAEKAYSDQLSKGQFKGAISTVDKLLAGKQKAAKDWFDSGMQGQPNFGGGITPPPTGGAPKEGDTKVNSHGDKVKFSGGKWGPA